MYGSSAIQPTRLRIGAKFIGDNRWYEQAVSLIEALGGVDLFSNPHLKEQPDR